MHNSELDSFAIKDIITYGQIVTLRLRCRDVQHLFPDFDDCFVVM